MQHSYYGAPGSGNGGTSGYGLNARSLVGKTVLYTTRLYMNEGYYVCGRLKLL